MMTVMRSFVKSKWALGLFALLIISFGVFGVTDPFSGVSGGGFVRAGERSLGARDVSRALDQEIRSIREQNGEVLSQSDAAKRGIPQAIVQELTQQLTALAYADRIGLKASPTAVAEIIDGAPIFQNGLGQVDRDAIARYASEQGYSVPQFETYLQDSLTYDYLRQAALGGLKAPDILSRPIITFLSERRTLTVARLTEASLPVIPPPTEADLKAFYQERSAAFAQPERRILSALSYTAEDFLDKVKVAPADVKAEYDRRIKEFSGPETREIAQFTASTQKAIQDVVDGVKQGKTLEAVAAATPGVTLARLTVKAADLTDKPYSDTVFALPKGETFGPMPLGQSFVGVQIVSITPGPATPFADLEETLSMDVARRDARKLFDSSEETFYDMASGGASLEDMGSEVGAPVIAFAPIDGSGRFEGGEQAGLLARHPEAVTAAFSLAAGEMGQIIEADGERLVLRVDTIVPARTPAFEEVSARLPPLYLAAKQVEAAQKAAADVLAAIQGGKTLEAAAAAGKMRVIRVPEPITRANAGGLDPAILEGVFALKAGAPAVVRDNQGEPWLVRVEAIEPGGTNPDPQMVAQVSGLVQQSLTRDIGEAFSRGVTALIKPKSNQGAIQTYLDGFKTEEAP